MENWPGLRPMRSRVFLPTDPVAPSTLTSLTPAAAELDGVSRDASDRLAPLFGTGC